MINTRGQNMDSDKSESRIKGWDTMVVLPYVHTPHKFHETA